MRLDSEKQWRNKHDRRRINRISKRELTIEVSHPEHDVGYYYSINKPDEHNITVKIKLCGETICEDTSYS